MSKAKKESTIDKWFSKWNAENGIYFAVFGLVLIIYSLPVCYPLWISGIVVGLITIYLIILIIGAAIFSDKKEKWKKCFWHFFPTRSMGLFLFTIFFVCLIFSWANFYLQFGNDFAPLKIDSYWDAVYFSFITFLTASDASFVPNGPSLRIVMSLEILNAFILFFAAFPLLLSRMSNFNDIK